MRPNYKKQVYHIKAIYQDGNVHDYGEFVGLKAAWSAYNYFALSSAIIRKYDGEADKEKPVFEVTPPFPENAEELAYGKPKLKEL
jgi:hypothetical protein